MIDRIQYSMYYLVQKKTWIAWLAFGKIILVGSWLASSPSVFGQSTAQNGFLGFYFNSVDFSERALVRFDSEIDFVWQTQSPGPGVNRDGFSAMWQGALTPEFSELYTFVIQSDGLANLWIDDVLVVDGSRSPTSRIHSGKIPLSSGQAYMLKLDYVHDSGDAFARLFWTSSSRPLEIIPMERVTLQSGNTNLPPIVQVPASQSVSPPSMELLLAGNVFDDDFSSQGQIGQDYGSVTWSQSSGPGEVQFEDTSNPVTRVVFPILGTYVLNLEAIDEAGLRTNAATTVTVGDLGFLGFYFNSVDFSERALVRFDSEIDFVWQAQSPGPGVNRDGFSAMWQGALTPEFSELYTFVIQSDGPANLWIDGVLVVDGSLSPISRIHSGKITLSSGQAYMLMLDYVHESGDAFARLFWTSSSRPLEIIPRERVTLQLEDTNLPPMVRVPAVLSVSPPFLELTLVGNVVDDDFSSQGQIGQDYGSVTWSQSSGPGDVQFEDPSNPVTRVTFPLMGEYALNLEATDEAGQSSNAEIVVIVDHPPWPMHHIDKAFWNHNSLSPHDVNGDGFDDYSVMHEGPDLYTLIFHPGPDGDEMAIWPKTIVGQGGNPEYSYIADFDGDGNLDVVGVGGADGSQPPGVKVFWGPDPASSMDGNAWTDSGVFPQTANQGHFLYVEAHDVNADGLTDIVVGGRLQNNPRIWAGLFWLEAPQDASARRSPEAWDFHYIDPELKSGHGFVFTDIDQDGDNDFVVANADWNTPQSDEMVLWYENPGNGTTEQESSWPRHTIYHGDEFFAKPQVGVGDLNGDGLIDLCLQVRDELFYFKKTGLNPVTWERIVIPKPAYTQWLNRPIKIFDINGDGKLDIVGMLIHDFGNMEEGLATVFWMEYTGEDPTSDNWVTHVIKWSNGNDTGRNFRGEKWDHLRFLDMDLDGDMDIVGNCEEHYDSVRRTLVGVVWFENRLDDPAYTFSEDTNGLTVIEAENYTGMSDGDWFIHTDHNGFTGDGYLVEFHSEDQPAQDWDQSGGVNYEVNLEGGEYEVWVRRWVPSTWGRLGREKSNSVWLGINGQLIGESFFDNSSEGFNSWTWLNQSEDGSPLTVSLPEGRHLLNLQGREGGYAIDQIVIAQVATRFNRDDIYDWRMQNFDDTYADPAKETEWGWNRDPDSDGQTNLWEMFNGTNPFNPNRAVASFQIQFSNSQQLSASSEESNSNESFYNDPILQNDPGGAYIFLRRPKFAGIDAVLEHSFDVTNWTTFFDVYATTRGEIIEEGINYETIRIDPVEDGLTDLNGSFFRMVVQVPDD